MPAATSKRLKGLRVSRNFIIGNEAYQLPHPAFPSPPDGHSKGWKVYVRPLPNGPDITTWLKKVQFKLHHTYANASRTVEAPDAFEVSETGYGEFGVEIRLYFPPESGEKAQYREHYLILSPYGSQEQQDRQTKENKIVAEKMETIEFNEPPQEFFKSLTSEEQFNWLKVKKGRGKGKKPDYVFEGDVEPTAQLAEKAGTSTGSSGGAGGAWTTMYERQVIADLQKSVGLLNQAIEEEKLGMEKRKVKMEDLGRLIDSKG